MSGISDWLRCYGHFPGGSDGKESTCNTADAGFDLSPGEGDGYLPTPVF